MEHPPSPTPPLPRYHNLAPAYSEEIVWPIHLTHNVVRGDRQQRVFVQTVDLFGNNLTDGGSLVAVTATLEHASYNGSFGEYGQRLLDGIEVREGREDWIAVACPSSPSLSLPCPPSPSLPLPPLPLPPQVTSSTWLSIDPTEGRTVSGQTAGAVDDVGDIGGSAHYSIPLTDESSGVYSGSYHPLVSGQCVSVSVCQCVRVSGCQPGIKI